MKFCPMEFLIMPIAVDKKTYVILDREGENVTKEMIIQTALAGRKMPPKTSEHMVLTGDELKQISIPETVINIPLEKLNKRL